MREEIYTELVKDVTGARFEVSDGEVRRITSRDIEIERDAALHGFQISGGLYRWDFQDNNYREIGETILIPDSTIRKLMGREG